MTLLFSSCCRFIQNAIIMVHLKCSQFLSGYLISTLVSLPAGSTVCLSHHHFSTKETSWFVTACKIRHQKEAKTTDRKTIKTPLLWADYNISMSVEKCTSRNMLIRGKTLTSAKKSELHLNQNAFLSAWKKKIVVSHYFAARSQGSEKNIQLSSGQNKIQAIKWLGYFDTVI